MEIRAWKCRQVVVRARTESMVGREWRIWRRSSVARSVRSIVVNFADDDWNVIDVFWSDFLLFLPLLRLSMT